MARFYGFDVNSEARENDGGLVSRPLPTHREAVKRELAQNRANEPNVC